MKYKETCPCGTVMKFESNIPSEVARTKSQWKIDHEVHTEDKMDLERKRLVMEYTEMQARAKMAEDRAYPATVLGYDLQIGDKVTGKMLYQATLDPGNGFYWEDTNTNLIVSISPARMKLANVEDKAETERVKDLIVKAEQRLKGDSAAAKKMSMLEATAGQTAPPPKEGSILDALTKTNTAMQASTLGAIKREDEVFTESLMKKVVGLASDPLGDNIKRAQAEHKRKLGLLRKQEAADERRKQGESKGNKGTEATTGIVTPSRIQRRNVGRRGN